MNKKLLLLPVILMSSFMSACGIRTERISLDEILDYAKESHSPYYCVSDKTDDFGFNYELYADYGFSIYDIIKTNLVGATLVGKVDGYTGSYNSKSVEYRFDTPKQHKKMDYFTIYVYDDGTVNTCASGTGWFFYPKDQYTEYQISKEAANKIINDTKAVVEENEAIKEEKQNEAKEYATFENFFKEYAKKENASIEYRLLDGYNDHFGHYFKTYTIDDKDGDVLEDLMGLEYQFEEYRINIDSEQNIIVHANSDWFMIIDSTSGNGYMQYAYEIPSPIGGVDCITKYFTVNRSKLNALNDKLLNLVDDTK